MSPVRSGVSIILPTYNRAPALQETLEALAAVECNEDEVDLFVVDNASTDDTAAVALAFRERLPLHLLYEPRAGKNCAINLVLRECSLRQLVVFIDDDVTPAADWLNEIVVVSSRHPDVEVFGSRVDVRWPGGGPPEFAISDWVKAFGFSEHHYSDGESFYVPPACPFGPSWWMRASVLEKVPRFDESIGPRPTDRIMGSETGFLMNCHRQGIRQIYCPTVRVEHRLSEAQCSVRALRRRAYTFGRGQARLHGRWRQALFERSRIVWRLAMYADYAVAASQFVAGLSCRGPKDRCEATVNAVMRMGRVRESLKMVAES